MIVLTSFIVSPQLSNVLWVCGPLLHCSLTTRWSVLESIFEFSLECLVLNKWHCWSLEFAFAFSNKITFHWFFRVTSIISKLVLTFKRLPTTNRSKLIAICGKKATSNCALRSLSQAEICGRVKKPLRTIRSGLLSLGVPDLGRSVNPITTKGGRLCPPNNTGTPGFSDLPTAL